MTIKKYEIVFMLLGLVLLGSGIYLIEYMNNNVMGALVGGLIGNGIVSIVMTIISIFICNKNAPVV